MWAWLSAAPIANSEPPTRKAAAATAFALRSAEGLWVRAGAMAGLEPGDGRQVVFAQLEVEEVEPDLRDLDAVAEPDVRDVGHGDQLDERPIAISGKATMKPMKAPIAAPEPKVAVLERAPEKAPVTQTSAATPTPIQKMEGISRGPYRTAKAEGIPGRSLAIARPEIQAHLHLALAIPSSSRSNSCRAAKSKKPTSRSKKPPPVPPDAVLLAA
jgi:hypothetical protein